MDTTANLTNPCAVVVDGDCAVRNSLKFSLEGEGFAVRAYASGADLLNSVNSPDCDRLVIDQNLPGITGLERLSFQAPGAGPRWARAALYGRSLRPAGRSRRHIASPRCPAGY